MFFVVPEMPSKTVVMVLKKLPDHFNLHEVICHIGSRGNHPDDRRKYHEQMSSFPPTYSNICRSFQESMTILTTTKDSRGEGNIESNICLQPLPSSKSVILNGGPTPPVQQTFTISLSFLISLFLSINCTYYMFIDLFSCWTRVVG